MSASERTPLGILRVTGTYVFVGLLALLSRPTVPLVAMGAVFVAAGEALRLWAAGHLLKSKELAVSGPYRYTQNPLYLGRLLIMTGLCVMAYLPLRVGDLILPANLALLLAGYGVFFLYYMPRKLRVEGGRLQQIHGETWDAYARSVPILFPRTTPHGQNVRAWERARMARNREHWMLAGVALTTLIFLGKALARA